jgi:hypothetical protein
MRVFWHRCATKLRGHWPLFRGGLKPAFVDDRASDPIQMGSGHIMAPAMKGLESPFRLYILFPEIWKDLKCLCS